MIAEFPRTPAPRGRSLAELMGLVWTVGYLIAIPAFLFGFGGAYIDKYYLHMEPLGVVLGLALALFVSSVAVYRRVKDILRS